MFELTLAQNESNVVELAVPGLKSATVSFPIQTWI